jgi:LVIVD repeat
MRRTGAVGALSAIVMAIAAATLPAVATAQHEMPPPGPGFLEGPGEWGKIELIGKALVTDQDDLVADVAVDPSEPGENPQYAYLANWSDATCAENSEAGGVNAPDAGIWVIDISDLANPQEVGFIPHSQDSRPGEGLQAVEISTKFFTGTMLVSNNEQCGPQGKGGVSLYDVTNPLKPKKLSEHFGDRGFADFQEIHSAFAWDAGDNAYVVMTDNAEDADVDILDITNPHRPRLIADLNLNEYCAKPNDPIDQPDIGLTDSFLHDMVVKNLGTEEDPNWVMLLSYWDGGFVRLDVNNPAKPVCLDDTDYPAIDPELADPANEMVPDESRALTPEGNAHQAEFTIDNEFFIGGDEDFAPYRTGDFEITTGPNAGVYPSVIVPGGQPPAILEDLTLNGPVVYGGYGCPDSAPLPSPEDIPGYLDMLAEGEETIIVLQRGPVGDPSAPEEACFPGEKAHEAALAGWDAVLFVNHHTGEAAGGEPFCGSGAFVDEIVAVCTTHAAFHRLFGLEPLDPPWTYPEDIAIGTIGEEIEVGSIFDGWGYVHLFDADTGEELDTFAIPEAHDPAFAFGFGDLTVHEVAVDPQDASLAYLSYYSGGLIAIQIQCDGVPYDMDNPPANKSGCELVEVGGYRDPEGNDFWGVQTFVGDDGRTYILASDRDSGLWIFADP